MLTVGIKELLLGAVLRVPGNVLHAPLGQALGRHAPWRAMSASASESKPGGGWRGLPPTPGLQPHLHAGMSRRNGKMKTTACQSWRQVRRQGERGPRAHQGCQHGWFQPGPQCLVSQGDGPRAPHCLCCTWPCAGPACGQSLPPVRGCRPCSALSTHPASTRPGGGPSASPDADLQVLKHQNHTPPAPSQNSPATTCSDFQLG